MTSIKTLTPLTLALLLGLPLTGCDQTVGTDPETFVDDDDDDDDDEQDQLGDDDDAVEDDDDEPADDDDDEPEPPADDDDAAEEPPVVGSGECTPSFALSCGLEIAGDTTLAGATNEIAGYNCSSWDASGPEVAYTFTATESGPVTAALVEIADGEDLDIYVIADDGIGCTDDGCVAYGNTDATFDAVAGETYHFVVDGFFGAAGSFVLGVECGDEPPVGDDDDDEPTPGDDDDSEPIGDDDDSEPAGDDDDSEPPPNDVPGVCVPAMTLTDGDVVVGDNGGIGSTDAIDQWGCAAGWDESGPEYVYEYTATVTGQATATVAELADDLVELVFGPLDELDIFVLNANQGCQAGACIAASADTISWGVTAGSTWYIVVDGYQGDTSLYEVSLSEVSTTPPTPTTETSCTDGIDDDGDGLIDCDDSDCASQSACEVGSCIQSRVLDCGDTDSWNNSGYGSWSLIDDYSCVGWNESGPEYTYLFTAPATGSVEVALTGMSADLDVFVVSEEGTGCEAGNCFAHGNTNATWDAVAGQTYYVVVDGYNGAVSDYDLTVTCD